MTLASKTAGLVSTVALSLALAACGGGGDEADAPAETVATGAAVTPSAEDTTAPNATPTPGATPSETPSATPSPTPMPSASASAAPTTAAVTEPAAFAVCKACHSVEPGKNGIGPSLAGIWGEKAAKVPGYDFSEGMEKSGLTWNQATLDRYLTDPQGVVPGTKMSFGGVKDAAKRQQIIDYIKSL